MKKPLPFKKPSKNIISFLVQEFSNLYPNPKSELDFTNPYELVVSVALSAQCTDKKVNEVTKNLFKKYSDFKSLAEAKISDIEKVIRQVNYYKSKSKNIVELSKKVTDEFNGSLPTEHELLTSLPGVGNKTANVVLSEMGITQTFPVDTHVYRVSRKLGLTISENVKDVEEDLKKIFPANIWRPMHHWLIFHGRRICKAQNPQCSICTLRKKCQYGKNLKI